MNVRRSLKQYLTVFTLFTLVTLTAWIAWDNWGRFALESTTTTSMVDENANVNTQTIAHGKYLAQIGGCISCHTTKGGDPLAGGRKIDTPFGAVFSSNLTPSQKNGLGNWTLLDFQNALRWGRSKDGRLLLPVFPYNHTSVLTDEDSQAIFVWLKTIKPVEKEQRSHLLAWPLGTQPIIAVWRSLFFKPTPYITNTNESDTWNRGAYLVQSAGHCAACHGQRNFMGSFPAVDDLSGGFLYPQMWTVPSLRDAKQTTLANDNLNEIAKLLRTGQNHSANVSGPMAEFVQQSSQYLSESDALAIATYLHSKVNTETHPTQVLTTSLASSSPSSEALYKTHCATCHGINGEGKVDAYPALAGNPAVVSAQSENLIQKTLYGGYGPSTAERPRPYGMPPYLFTLSNQQIADVLNYIRSQWGNTAEVVSPMQVDRVRAAAY